MPANIMMLIVVLSLVGAWAFAQEELPRVGFEENFDTADGWQVANGPALKSITVKDCTVRFETVCGALNARMKRDDWPEWPKKPFASWTSIKKEYGTEVDLDTYRYLVV